jgi:hypothetical protein
LQDRELTLFDGTRLVRWDRYQTLLELVGSAKVLTSRKVFPIRPSFRVVALAAPPSLKTPWLTPEILSLFSWHHLVELPSKDKQRVLAARFPTLAEAHLTQLFTFAEHLQRLSSPAAPVYTGSAAPRRVALPAPSSGTDASTVLPSTSTSTPALMLSLRQLLRVCTHLTKHGPSCMSSVLSRVLLVSLLPHSLRAMVTQAFHASGIALPAVFETRDAPVLTITDTTLTLGDASHPRAIPTAPELVPRIVFFDIPAHRYHLHALLRDLLLPEKHILLIGNQGVGKNKLADRLLELLRLEREYMQLHRDTTIAQLTATPTLVNGRVAFVDSPLVRAVRDGRVLVIDEADKAPLEVVAILKGLIEDGQLLLADGRRILRHVSLATGDAASLPVSATVGGPLMSTERIIRLHPAFKLIVLANRAGYPFLGNDFFRECGDVLSCHVIDNPDAASELALLQSYAPSVPVPLLKQLTQVFAALRQGVEDGLFAYPYSTREAVAIARHLHSYPRDGMMHALRNVLAFDAYDATTRDNLQTTFQRFGIPIGDGWALPAVGTVQLARATALPPAVPHQSWSVRYGAQSELESSRSLTARHAAAALSGPSVVSTASVTVTATPVAVTSKRMNIAMAPEARVESFMQHRVTEFREVRASFHAAIASDARVLAAVSLADGTLVRLTSHK